MYYSRPSSWLKATPANIGVRAVWRPGKRQGANWLGYRGCPMRTKDIK